MEGLLPVRGQIFFLLLPNFLPIFFLDRNKHIGNCPVFLASPTVCPLLSQPGLSSCLQSLEGSLLLPVHSQAQVLQLLTHQLIHLQRQKRVWRGGPGPGRTGRRGRDGGRGGEEDSSLRAEPDEHSEGSRWPITFLCLLSEPLALAFVPVPAPVHPQS